MAESSSEALRLTFAFEPGGVRLRSSQRVTMRVGKTDPVSGYEGEAGMWCELRDSSDRVLFRRVLPDPRRPLEAFSDDPARSLSRAEESPASAVTVVLVPVDARAVRAALLEGASGLRVAARELCSVDLAAVP